MAEARTHTPPSGKHAILPVRALEVDAGVDAGGVAAYALRLGKMQLICAAAWLASGIPYVFLGRPLTGAVALSAGALTLLLAAWTRPTRGARELRGALHATVALSALGLTVGALITGQSRSLMIWFLVLAPLLPALQDGTRAAMLWSAVALALIAGIGVSEMLVPITPEFLATGAERLAGQAALVGVILAFGAGARRILDAHITALDGRRSALETALEERDTRGAELSRTNAQLRSLVENLRAGVVVTDDRDRVVFASAQFTRMFDVPEGALQPSETPWRRFLLEHIAPLAKEPEELVAADLGDDTGDGGIAVNEVVLTGDRIIERDYVPIREGGRRAGALRSFRDVTDQRSVEVMKGHFIATVSHELRTPLTAIQGPLRLMEGGAVGELNPKQRELIRVAWANSERLLKLVNDLLSFQEIESGSLEVDDGVIPARRIVNRTVAGYRASAEQAGVRLISQVRHDGRVRGDEPKLVQALGQLLSNAIKFSPVHTRVEVRLERTEQGRMRFSVIDQGEGVDPLDAPKMFQRFRQLDDSDTRPVGGTGLGLALAKGIVEEHGGVVGVSGQLGHGATFWFELPETTREPVEA